MSYLKTWVIALIFIWAFLLTNIYNFNVDNWVFTSPDEASYYQVTKQYSQNWVMYLTWNNLDIDIWNNLHPRWFITLNEKIVPFSALWLPLYYGPLFSIIWDGILYLWVFFFIITWLALFKIIDLVFKRKVRVWLVFFLLLNCVPYIYYLNFPFYNIVMLVPFFLISIYYLIKFYKYGNTKYLYLSYMFSLTVIHLRNEYLLFLLFIYLCYFVYDFRSFKKKFFKIILPIWIISLLYFIFPLTQLNLSLYWEPFTYWYNYFTNIFYWDTRANSSMQSIWNIFLPWLEFNFSSFKNNFYSNITRINWLTLLSLCFIISILLNSLKKQSNTKFVWFSALLIVIYYLLYQWASNTYWSWLINENIWYAVTRYWIMIHVLSVIVVAYWLNCISKYYKYIILCVLFLWFTLNMITELNNYQSYWDSTRVIIDSVLSQTSENSYIIAPMSWKYLYKYRKVISWRWWHVDWNLNFEKDIVSISSTLKFLIESWYDIYWIRFNWFNNYHLQLLMDNWINSVDMENDLVQLYLWN